ncbi:peptidase A4 family-domain-containing protein [Aspergillus multicolor]|uniref:A4/G1 family peptidase n=1 Tax=Aspergillus multicolor TaxID=41759 RepID=UPI003CCE468F
MKIACLSTIASLCFVYLVPALAAPSRHDQIWRPRRQRISNPLREVKYKPAPGQVLSLEVQSEEQEEPSYSSNWAGAVLENAPANAFYSFVSATITAPTPTATSTATGSTGTPSTYQAASAWVGIDGATYTAAILQTGLDFYVINGEPYTDAWFEWYPGYAEYYNEFYVTPGDVLVLSVNITSPDKDKGVCTVENRSTGVTVSETVSAPKSTATLAGSNAEWVVENFQSGGEPVPFVEFDEVHFTECQAGARNTTVGLENARIYALVLEEKVVAEVDMEAEANGFYVRDTRWDS